MSDVLCKFVRAPENMEERLERLASQAAVGRLNSWRTIQDDL